ncbi:MarR family winged helix-turn-helix transcriptional regulator [Nocardioides humilatus]|uniref:MarR family winged helix-turn-helix transcriptional regulator n=1 Tax=Nocardioides humilatus TaxID=2607660 RepID=UPI00165F96AF|nr:MarR family winged helix-turn-helix transcriptional regulator [Nocardioides humilatus]
MTDPDAIDDALLRALGDELIRLSRRRMTNYPDARLDNSAFKILWLLVETGPMTLKEIGEQLQLEQSTINRQVNSAIDRGLAERALTPGQTARTVRATAAGEDDYRHDAGLRAAAMREALGELGPDHAATVIAGLGSLNDAFDRAQARIER